MKRHLKIILIGFILTSDVFCKVRNIKTNDQKMFLILFKNGKIDSFVLSRKTSKNRYG